MLFIVGLSHVITTTTVYVQVSFQLSYVQNVCL